MALEGRKRRIAAKNPGMSKSEVAALAKKRDAAYRANSSRTGLKGGGVKGSIKRAVFRKGTKADAKALKSTSKEGKRIVRTNTKALKKWAKANGRGQAVTRVEALRLYASRSKRKSASK